jgi:hypothetical protein
MRGFNRRLLLALAVVAGCRGLPQPVPSPAAHETQMGQLKFVSDFPLPADHRLVRELAAERDDVCAVLDLPATNEQITVYLFSDAEHYGRFLSRQFPTVPSRRAFFLETDTALAVYAHWSDRVAEDLRHEVAHGYLHAATPGLPLWLDEGLAEYFEVPRGNGGLNRPHLDLLVEMREHENWQPNIARLEQITDAAEMEQLDYAEAWAWVYYLLHAQSSTRSLLVDYLAEVRAQGRAAPLSARLSAIHAAPDRALVGYLASMNSYANRPTGHEVKSGK